MFVLNSQEKINFDIQKVKLGEILTIACCLFPIPCPHKQTSMRRTCLFNLMLGCTVEILIVPCSLNQHTKLTS